MARSPANIIKVWSLASNDATDRNNGVVPPRFGSAHHNQRNLESAGNTNDGDVAFVASRLLQSLHRSCNETFHNFRIEPAGHDANMQSRRTGFGFDFLHSIFRISRYFPL